ncbi:MAG: nuclear transport factor 2 family protein [Solirubrobacterales bacterium]
MSHAWTQRMALAAVCVGLISGCGGGGGGGQQTAEDTARAYVEARNQGDAAKVCELYSDRLIRTLRTSNCVGFVKEQTSGTATDLTLVKVSERGDVATATVQARLGGNVANAIAPIELKLTKENGEWRISGLGGPGSR